MDKSELLKTLLEERAQLEARLAEMSEAQLTERAAPDAWSVKDNLAHLTYWEQYMLDKVRQAVDRGEAPQQVTKEEETQINAQVFEDSKNRPLNEVMADMRRSLGQVVEQVRALSEAEVTDSTRFAWLNGEPLMKYIADETYGEHYQEHLGHLMA